MTQDWTAVAATIKEHMIRLGLNQDQLAERSGVAKSIVRELLHNTTQRRRHGRTLEAISRSGSDSHRATSTPSPLASLHPAFHEPAVPTPPMFLANS